jgi:hypothetical protein
MSSMPWLMPRKKTVTVMDASPEGKPVGEKDAIGEDLMSAAEDLMSAIAMKDAKALALAMKACFQICDAQPHVEGEHDE